MVLNLLSFWSVRFNDCREREVANIYEFLQEFVQSRVAGDILCTARLYGLIIELCVASFHHAPDVIDADISGVPGTGKTATVNVALRRLEQNYPKQFKVNPIGLVDILVSPVSLKLLFFR